MQLGTLIVQDMWVLILIASLGTILRLWEKWTEAKKKYPGIKFDAVYAKYSIISVLAMVYMFSELDIKLSGAAAFLALASGYSGQIMTTGGIKTLLTPTEPVFTETEET